MNFLQFFPESGLTLVVPWYPVSLPSLFTIQHTGWLISLYTVYLQGISLQAVGEDMGGGLGAESEACHPVLHKAGNMTPQASPETPGPSLSPLQEEAGCREH